MGVCPSCKGAGELLGRFHQGADGSFAYRPNAFRKCSDCKGSGKGFASPPPLDDIDLFRRRALDSYEQAVAVQADLDAMDYSLPGDPVTADWIEAWGYGPKEENGA